MVKTWGQRMAEEDEKFRSRQTLLQSMPKAEREELERKKAMEAKKIAEKARKDKEKADAERAAEIAANPELAQQQRKLDEDWEDLIKLFLDKSSAQ